MEVAEKPWFGDFDVFGGAESDAFLEERRPPAKKTQLAGSTGGGSCTMPCAWEPKMEIPGEHVIQFERPDAVIDSVREVWSEVRVTAPNDSLHPAANTKN